MSDELKARARYAIEHGSSDQLHRDLLAALETVEAERDRLRELARDTAQMFGQIEGSGELYYAPLHRQIDLLAEVAEVRHGLG